MPDTDTSGCAARVEINGAYLNIIDTINGTKAVDVELHCLTELVCFGREEVQYISDMYCNTAAITPRMGKLSIPSDCELHRVSLSFSESIEAPEDCADVLAAFTRYAAAPCPAGRSVRSASRTSYTAARAGASQL